MQPGTEPVLSRSMIDRQEQVLELLVGDPPKLDKRIESVTQEIGVELITLNRTNNKHEKTATHTAKRYNMRRNEGTQRIRRLGS